MIGFELYVFFLCLLIFIVLTLTFSSLIYYIGKQKGLIISSGLEDGKIKEKVMTKLNKSTSTVGKIYDIIMKIFSMAILFFLCIVFIITGIFSCRGDENVKNIPAIKVIASTSMSERYENNTYLFKNNLTNQLQLFDVVLLHELPPEDEIELFDIVVYEHISGALLIHRIVGIEEPNEEHPNERYFLLQGDAVHYPDTFPVRYSQMRSIYRNERIPNIGSFVYFMQSPAGIMCVILAGISLILMPIADNYLIKKEFSRVLLMVENGELDKKALDLYKKGRQKTLKEKNNVNNDMDGKDDGQD